MVGILIISHGSLAAGFEDAASMIMGKQHYLSTIGLKTNEGPKDLKVKMKDEIKKLDQGEGVLVLADLFGGTPANAAVYLLNMEEKVEVVTGVNLPVLLELLNLRTSQSLNELVESFRKFAGQGFKVLSDVI